MTDNNSAKKAWPSLRTTLPFDVCLVAEEIGDDFGRVIASAETMGIEELELGSLWGERIDRVPFGSMVRARDMLRDRGIRVRMVATQAFKTVSLDSVEVKDIDSDPQFCEHMDLLRSSIAAAQFFDAPLVRTFSFRRSGMVGLGNPSPRQPGGGDFPERMAERVAAALKLAVRETRDAGLTLALENVRSCWGDSGRNTREIFDRVDSKSLQAIWDPANAFVSGEDDAVEGGYAAVKPDVVHVHLKDAAVEDRESGLTRWERIGDGEVGLGRQLRKLREDSFVGCVSIETHWLPPGSDREINTWKTFQGFVDLLAG